MVAGPGTQPWDVTAARGIALYARVFALDPRGLDLCPRVFDLFSRQFDPVFCRSHPEIPLFSAVFDGPVPALGPVRFGGRNLGVGSAAGFVVHQDALGRAVQILVLL